MLLFIRHARSLSNEFTESTLSNYSDFDHEDPSLSFTGRAQAQEAAYDLENFLKTDKKTITRVIISPLLRTMETGGIILDHLNYKGVVELDPLVRERHEHSIAERGTKKSELLDLLQNKGHPLSAHMVDPSKITEELWYDLSYEQDGPFLKRIEQIRETYVTPHDAPNNEITLIISHSAIGNNLLDLEGAPIKNAQIVNITPAGSKDEILFTPQFNHINYPPSDYKMPDPRSLAYSWIGYSKLNQRFGHVRSEQTAEHWIKHAQKQIQWAKKPNRLSWD